MARIISQSQLELFTTAYLKRIRNKGVLRRERKFIKKAISMLIAITADSPCCTDAFAVIDLYTPYDNTLTNAVRTLTIGINRRKWGKSIQRILDLLNNTLNDPCCDNITMNFSATLGQQCICPGTTVTFDLVGQAGQGTYSFVFDPTQNTKITLPLHIHGLFNICMGFSNCCSCSTDSLQVQPKDINGTNVGGAFVISFDQSPKCGVDDFFANFLIENVASFVFTCQSSG